MKNVIKSTPKEELLGFDRKDLEELWEVKKDFYFYKGSCKADLEEALSDQALLGQTWIPNPNTDYTPTVDIRNKIKALMDKQKRFMFGVEPTITLKPTTVDQKDKTEAMTSFIMDILDENGFWKDLQLAFLSATIKKKVLLRVEANPGQPINIFFEEVEDFNYKTNPKNYKKIDEVILVKKIEEIDENGAEFNTWTRYTYYMNPKTNTCWVKTELYNNDTVNREADEVTNSDTLLSKLPAWLIVNGGTLGNNKGESDITDLMEVQNQYNRKISDFGDALRFQMFGETYIIDGTPATVNAIKIAPNSLCPIASIDGDRKANVLKLQSSFTSASPTDSYLDRAEKDMYEQLSIPRPEQLANVPSGKAMEYLYTELKSRCEEKWNDWESSLKKLIYFIVECCSVLNCYDDWDINWNDIDFKVQIQHNYPIPEDEETKKEIALKEVEANVRSRQSYIQDYTQSENSQATWTRILDEIVQLQSAQQDNFQAQLEQELLNMNTEESDNIEGDEHNQLDGNIEEIDNEE